VPASASIHQVLEEDGVLFTRYALR
jgi:hypothetical protein